MLGRFVLSAAGRVLYREANPDETQHPKPEPVLSVL